MTVHTVGVAFLVAGVAALAAALVWAFGWVGMLACSPILVGVGGCLVDWSRLDAESAVSGRRSR